jgi:hypothetical protein
MKVMEIKKASGGIRRIYAPNPEELTEYRTLLSKIAQPPVQLKSAHGFMPGRNIVTNALPHAGKPLTISMDLSDFFDSVRPDMLKGRVPVAVLEKCFLSADGIPGTTPDCRTRQGLPTSPALANLAAAPLDEAIRKRLAKMEIPGAVYTRYADDLSISMDCTDQETAQKVVAAVSEMVSRCGFRLNGKKTRIRRATGGNRECFGIMATEGGVEISRRMRRVIRAAEHNLEVARKRGTDGRTVRKLERKVKGLREFAALKKPREIGATKRTAALRLADAREIARACHLRAPRLCRKDQAEQTIGKHIHITNDPAMILGMSSFTTGWTSCMAILGRHEYAYYKGVTFWVNHPGVSLAYIDSGATMTIAGVTRPKMAARTLVYALRDGRHCYGDIYYGNGHRIDRNHPLAQALEAAGYLPATACHGALVKGRVKKGGCLPYFDNATPEDVALKGSGRRAYRVRIK